VLKTGLYSPPTLTWFISVPEGNNTKPRGTIPLVGASVGMGGAVTGPGPYAPANPATNTCFYINGHKKNYVLSADTQEEAQAWVTAILDAVRSDIVKESELPEAVIYSHTQSSSLSGSLCGYSDSEAGTSSDPFVPTPTPAPTPVASTTSTLVLRSFMNLMKRGGAGDTTGRPAPSNAPPEDDALSERDGEPASEEDVAALVLAVNSEVSAKEEELRGARAALARARMQVVEVGRFAPRALVGLVCVGGGAPVAAALAAATLAAHLLLRRRQLHSTIRDLRDEEVSASEARNERMDEVLRINRMLEHRCEQQAARITELERGKDASDAVLVRTREALASTQEKLWDANSKLAAGRERVAQLESNCKDLEEARAMQSVRVEELAQHRLDQDAKLEQLESMVHTETERRIAVEEQVAELQGKLSGAEQQLEAAETSLMSPFDRLWQGGTGSSNKSKSKSKVAPSAITNVPM